MDQSQFPVLKPKSFKKIVFHGHLYIDPYKFTYKEDWLFTSILTFNFYRSKPSAFSGLLREHPNAYPDYFKDVWSMYRQFNG